jgi:hypothetical protein
MRVAGPKMISMNEQNILTESKLVWNGASKISKENMRKKEALEYNPRINKEKNWREWDENDVKAKEWKRKELQMRRREETRITTKNMIEKHDWQTKTEAKSWYNEKKWKRKV